MTRCEPENGHELEEGYFWLGLPDGQSAVYQWFVGDWYAVGLDIIHTPEELHSEGWKVLQRILPPEGYGE